MLGFGLWFNDLSAGKVPGKCAGMLCGSAKIQRPGRQRILFGTHAWLARTGEPDRTLRTHLARQGLSYRPVLVWSGSLRCPPTCEIKAYDSQANVCLGSKPVLSEWLLLVGLSPKIRHSMYLMPAETTIARVPHADEHRIGHPE